MRVAWKLNTNFRIEIYLMCKIRRKLWWRELGVMVAENGVFVSFLLGMTSTSHPTTTLKNNVLVSRDIYLRLIDSNFTYEYSYLIMKTFIIIHIHMNVICILCSFSLRVFD